MEPGRCDGEANEAPVSLSMGLASNLRLLQEFTPHRALNSKASETSCSGNTLPRPGFLAQRHFLRSFSD